MSGLYSSRYEFGCRINVENWTAVDIWFLHQQSRCNYAILIYFLYRNSDRPYIATDVRLTFRYQIYISLLHRQRQVRYTILISLWYRHPDVGPIYRCRTDMDPMQFCHLGDILCYGKLFQYEWWDWPAGSYLSKYSYLLTFAFSKNMQLVH